eukprot:3880261-Amphidinium_carterae.2
MLEDRPSLRPVKKAKQEEAEITIAAYADSDWGTCKKWTRKQACVALSSVEAELIALTTGLTEGTYVRNLLCELLDFDADDKASIPLHVHTDSAAGRCIVFEEGRAHLHKVVGITNPADPFTKPASAEAEGSQGIKMDQTHEAEVQWTRIEQGRMFRDLKLRGRALAGVVIASLTPL